jgi:hypothetical protein
MAERKVRLSQQAAYDSDALVASLFQARLQVDSTTQISLQRFAGQYVYVNGELVDPTASGFTLANSANLISSTGTDSGGAPAADTLYYCYVSNSKSTFAASGIRLSATASSLYNGVKYLATSGNGLHWRFVGWVRMNGSTQFTNSSAARHAVNYYNRRKLSILVAPGYVDDNALSTYTTTSTTFTPANGGTGSQSTYIANGEDVAEFRLNVLVGNSGANACYGGIGDNSTANAIVSEQMQGTAITSFSASWSSTPAEGYRTINLLISVSAGTGTYYADNTRRGSAADPYATFIEGTVLG